MQKGLFGRQVESRSRFNRVTNSKGLEARKFYRGYRREDSGSGWTSRFELMQQIEHLVRISTEKSAGKACGFVTLGNMGSECYVMALICNSHLSNGMR